MTEVKSTLSSLVAYAFWAFLKVVIALFVLSMAEFAGSAVSAQGLNDGVVWQNSVTAAVVAPAATADATSYASSCASVDASYMNGVDTVDSVHVDSWSHVEGSLCMIAVGLQILALIWGGPTMIVGFMHMACGTPDGLKKMLFGAGAVAIGSAAPTCVNWWFAIVL